MLLGLPFGTVRCEVHDALTTATSRVFRHLFLGLTSGIVCSRAQGAWIMQQLSLEHIGSHVGSHSAMVSVHN